MGYGGKQASRSGDVRRFNFTGNGSNTAFDLGFTPATPNQLIVSINGVIQHYDAFSLTGSTITFTGTPASGDTIQVTAVVDAVGVAGIPDGAVANVSSLRVTTTPVLIGNAVGTFTGPLIQAASNANSWIQINAQNLNNGNNASTDMVLARSDGNDTAGFIDVGINSNTYAQAGYSIMQPNSGYMFTNGGDLVLGTQTSHNILFHTGNTTAASERVRIDNNGNLLVNLTSALNYNAQSAKLQLDTTGIAIKRSDGNYPNAIYNKNADNSFWITNQSGTYGTSYYLTADGQHVWTNSTDTSRERMRITPSGAVTIPNQPCFYAVRQAGNITATQVIVFDIVITAHSSYDNTTGRFTAPIAGKYLFMANALRNTGYSTNWAIRKNGTAVAMVEDTQSTTSWSESSQSCILSLAVGDYVDVQLTNGGIYASGYYTNFSGHLIG